MSDFKFPFVGKSKGCTLLFLSESASRNIGGETRDIDVFYIEPEGVEIVLPIGEIEILTDDLLSEG